MRIRDVTPEAGWLLRIVTEDGRTGTFDVKPYLDLPVFQPLKDESEFSAVHSGGYFVEWACGADLSADTIEAHLVQHEVDAVDQTSAVVEKTAMGRFEAGIARDRDCCYGNSFRGAAGSPRGTDPGMAGKSLLSYNLQV